MIEFTVPDFYEKGQFNLDWVNFKRHYPEKFETCKVSYVYGSFPLMTWAGGRQNKVDHINFVGLDDVVTIINRFNYEGIGVVFTFTNSALYEEHLGDWYCNACLGTLVRNPLNAVLVNSPILENYIREKYPQLRIFRSTTTCKTQLEEGYDLIVADYRLNNTPQLLQIEPEQRSRVEIMLNDTCPPYCAHRQEHYQYISQYNLRGGNSRINPENGWKCYHPEYKTSFYRNLQINDSYVNLEQLKAYHNAGFNHFKIVGREFNPIQLAEIYTYYMVRPECREEVMSWAIFRYSNVKGE